MDRNTKILGSYLGKKPKPQFVSEKWKQSENYTKIETIPLVSENEARDLIALGTGEKLEYDKAKTVVDLFLAQVKANPNATAVVDYKSSITYAELDKQSDILANELVKKGIIANDFVAVKLPRIKEFVVAAIGIWKAGAAYVPLDPEYPQDRISHMLQDCEAKIVIDEEFLSHIDFTQETKKLNLATPTSLAYMIYTSGSTGKPKGVMIAHESLTTFINSRGKELKLKPELNIAEYARFSFDASISDLYPTLCNGATLHILADHLIKDLYGIEKYFKDNNIIGVSLPTQFGVEFLSACEPNLQYVIIGGEKLNSIKKTSIRIYNDYGPTEFTVCSSTHIVNFEKDKKNIPIGRPVPNSISAVVNENGNLLPRGAAGELVLIGPQLSKGYWKQQKLTAEKFVDCPFLQGQKMYKTGDLVRWNENGELLFIGRLDNQVKLRGFRIELGEIESAVSKMDNIKSCVAAVREINGIQHLVAYYVSDKKLNKEKLTEELSKILAEYMVPDIFVRLDTMPLTHNGKIDRHALPLPEEIKAEEIVAPETDFEKQIFDIVSKELGTKNFGVTTNLISMGLTSIKAIKLSAIIHKKIDYSLKTSDILSKPYIREWTHLADKETEKIDILPKQKTYPLTQNQLGIYIDWERNRNARQYNLTRVFQLNVEPQNLLTALNNVIEAHPYFKVHFTRDKTGQIVQERRDEQQLPVIFEKLDTEPDRNFFQKRVKPFNLLKDDLARFEIYYTDNATYFFFDIHHTLFDGTSANIFLSELFDSYDGKEFETEQVTAYDYSLFLEKWRESEDYTNAEKYFANLISETEPFFYSSMNSNLHATGKSETYVGELSRKNIKTYCSNLGVTENTFFATVLTQVLHRISREDNIQISTISNGRSLEQLTNTIGMFVQTLPLVSKKSKGKISEILTSIQEQIIATIKNDKYPYTELVEKYGVKPNLFYLYQGDVIDRDDARQQIKLELDTVRVPLLVEVTPRNDTYNLSLEYDNGLYARQEIEILANAITSFANNLVKQTADARIETISLTSDKETQTLMELGTGEKLEYDKAKTVVDLFLAQVKENPNLTAVLDYKSSITYAELDKQSNVLANELVRKGIKVNDFVAVKLPRVKEFIVAVIGIWKAGAAYVPIDTKYPQDRIDYMIKDCETKIVIDEAFLSHIDFDQEVKKLNLATPTSLAYMIYTSGSTGKPKGVMIAHESLRAFISWMEAKLKLKPGANIAEYASFSFDASVSDLYPTLCYGATLHILGEHLIKDLYGVEGYIKDNKIIGVTLPTQFGVEFFQACEPNLKYSIIGGEKLKSIKETPTRIYNDYGPTEFTVWSSTHTLNFAKDKENIPIGRPVPNSISAIVDKNGNLLPRGIAGELVLMGPQISRGYWKRSDLTKEKFVDCPFLQGQKMYRTGDLVRWNDNNELVFIGRIDNQVKLRGFRIELGEIESVLSKINGIKSCIVEVKTINDTQHLVAYYVSDNYLDEEKLKQERSKSLTDYMVPDIFMRLDTMPLTPNGKVNRHALPLPELKAQEIVPPETDDEALLLNIAQNVLGTKNIGVTSDLFKLGLTSIQAIKFVAMVQNEHCSIRIGLNDVLQLKTIRNIATLQNKIGAWYREFDKGKPCIVFVLGLTSFSHAEQIIEQLSNMYNCFLFKSIQDHYDYACKGKNIEEVAHIYDAFLNAQLPEGISIKAFAGHSMGGEIALRMARLHSMGKHDSPYLFLWDTYLKYPEGQVFKVDKNIGITEAMEMIKVAKIAELLMKNRQIPSYLGQTIYFRSKKYDNNSKGNIDPNDLIYIEKLGEENLSIIKGKIPHVKIIDIDADHFAILKNTDSADLVL